jgi:hypothetical protein
MTIYASIAEFERDAIESVRVQDAPIHESAASTLDARRRRRKIN